MLEYLTTGCRGGAEKIAEASPAGQQERLRRKRPRASPAIPPGYPAEGRGPSSSLLLSGFYRCGYGVGAVQVPLLADTHQAAGEDIHGQTAGDGK